MTACPRLPWRAAALVFAFLFGLAGCGAGRLKIYPVTGPVLYYCEPLKG